MRRIVVGIAVLCSVVGISPATAQTYVPTWSPDFVEVAESSGTLVLTLVKGGPGPVRYRTEDGSCQGGNGITEPSSCEPPARAPGDYGAVSGEVIFTEAGSRQITIPIVDDRLGEGLFEAFTVYATEVDERGGWVAGTTSATVWIIDDDGDSDDAGEPAAATTSSTTTIRQPAPGSDSIVAAPPVRAPVVNAPPTTSPSSDLVEVELASGQLQPGPGFELTIDEGPQPAPDRPDGKGGSASSLALGLGTAAVVVGGVVMMRRGRRWSPTRA